MLLFRSKGGAIMKKATFTELAVFCIKNKDTLHTFYFDCGETRISSLTILNRAIVLSDKDGVNDTIDDTENILKLSDSVYCIMEPGADELFITDDNEIIEMLVEEVSYRVYEVLGKIVTIWHDGSYLVEEE